MVRSLMINPFQMAGKNFLFVTINPVFGDMSFPDGRKNSL